MTDEIDRTLPDGIIFQDKPKLRYPEEIMTDRITALTAENERLREVLTQIADGTMPRPLGKPWRMDMTSSKHDRCAHGAWMYEPCEGCIDAFIAAALEGKQ
jgi:hypothetical protein